MLCLPLGVWCAWLLAPALLCVGEKPRPVDVIVVLSGEDGSRMEAAARLYREGYAGRVLVSGVDEGMAEGLEALGVPAEVVFWEAASRNTAENARNTAELMEAHQWGSALVVTSWYHTRRARMQFERNGRGLAFLLHPTWQTPEVAKVRGSLRRPILMEYPKLLWCLVGGG